MAGKTTSINPTISPGKTRAMSIKMACVERETDSERERERQTEKEREEERERDRETDRGRE